MTVYELYLESGPKRRKTMVHVPELLGCVATGPTTEDALDATPDAIRAFRRFLHRHGEAAAGDREDPVDLRVVEHITEGDWLGNGSPYITFRHDLDPLSDAEIDGYLCRFRWLCDDLADWAATQSPGHLDVQPAIRGRTARAILLHVLGSQGAYLASALGGAPGFSRLHSAAERGEVDLSEALRRTATMVTERVRDTTPEERAAVRQIPAGPRSLRKAFRRMLEHDWEHLAELSRRPNGPQL
ncbi:MAG TPA: DinB family protein [Thermomicrobiales bacterium]|nr:DinB family protein [Thermomicrobiales bacterium]